MDMSKICVGRSSERGGVTRAHRLKTNISRIHLGISTSAQPCRGHIWSLYSNILTEVPTGCSQTPALCSASNLAAIVLIGCLSRE